MTGIGGLVGASRTSLQTQERSRYDNRVIRSSGGATLPA
jgi:hypothetical protein